MNYWEEYLDTVKVLGAEYARKYPMTEAEDIKQILWLWFAGHRNKYNEWSKLEQKDKDKLVAKSLRNAAIKYCEKEKAKKIGYEILDLYYYDASVIEAFLPSIISESYTIPTSIKDLNYKFSKGESTDTNNWLVLRSDISTAFYRLTEAKQNILRIKFSAPENTEWSKIATDMKTTEDGARMKVQRAVNSLIRNLGGYRPYADDDTIQEVETEDDDTSTES